MTAHSHRARHPPLETDWATFAAVSLSGFKCFNELPPVAIAPLTFITGPNSSGKSTILQAVLFLKQSLEATTPRAQFVFDDLVHLGSFDRVYCASSPKTDAPIFRISIDIACPPLSPVAQEELDIQPALYRLTFAVSRRIDATGKVESILQTLMAAAIDKGGRVHRIAAFHRRRNGTYRVNVISKALKLYTAKELSRLKVRLPAADTHAVFTRLMPTVIVFRYRETPSPRHKVLEHDIPIGMWSPLLRIILDVIRTELTESLLYIGPLRVEPETLYAETAKRIGVRGENAFAFLKANAHIIVANGRPLDRGAAPLWHCVREWLTHLGISKRFRLASVGDVHFEALADGYHLADVGCGVGQILPVIIQCLAAGPGNTVFLEQPEIHLHQSLQADLCDFLIAQVRRGVKVVCETHSDIMIQRLRRRIAEDARETLQGASAVYFVAEGGREVTKIDIDRWGNVNLWPERFFDQAVQEMRALANAQSGSGASRQAGV